MRTLIKIACTFAHTAAICVAVTSLGAQGVNDTASRPRLAPRIPPSPPMRSVRLAYVDSLRHPESVLFDAEQGVYFVSNMEGPSLAKDGKGFISRFAADGSRRELRWVASGERGITLNAPKGMAIVGDTLWVSDISTMRAFNRRTGDLIASIELAGQGAGFLNDVAAGPDGAVYVTDTELDALPTGNTRHTRTDRIFRVAGRSATIALQTDRLQRPNGLAWDRANTRFVIVPFMGDTIMTWRLGTSTVEPLVAGPGQYDGITFTPNGRMFVSCKSTSAIHELRAGKLEKVIEHLTDPADIEYDAVHDRIGIPLTAANRVEWYRLPN